MSQAGPNNKQAAISGPLQVTALQFIDY